MIHLKPLLLTEKIVLPVTINGNYTVTAADCDGLHHFEKYGKINSLVNKKLMEIYNAGINPDIQSVKVIIDSQKGSVNWSVTIKENTEGIAYTGFYTRGGGGGPGTPTSYPKYLSDTNGAHHTSIEQVKKSSKIQQRGTIDKISTVYVKEHYPDKGCNIKQFFYKYSLKEYPGEGISKQMSGNFMSKVLPIAINHKKQFQIPASITLAQAWLESGAGTSGLTTKYHNWFGITCGSWSGKCVELKNKQTGRLIKWRAYNTDKESFDDHAKLLTNRYKNYLKSDDPANDYEAWARALTRGRYAYANYGDFLIKVIKQQNFDKYDSGNFNQLFDEVEQNQKIRKVIGFLYYVLMGNPKKYFSKFTTWNPFVSNDGKKAASWFETWFNKNFLFLLEEIKKNTSKQNRFNIALIYLMVEHIANNIRNNDSSKFIFSYYVYDTKLSKYITRTIVFKFDYL